MGSVTELEYRICDNCKKEMGEGYCIDAGREYYCSDECLHKHYTEQEWEDLYGDGEQESYYTDWWDDIDEARQTTPV